MLYLKGLTDLIPVIPPGAQLIPTSKIHSSQLGKVPGRKLANGLWAGIDWRRYGTTLDDVKKWSLDGANIGLRAARYPAVDIDTLDGRLAEIVEGIAKETLGPAPVRTGRAPKRLLMYRTEEPFTRMRGVLKTLGGEHLIEVLGDGQQYLVYGTHPVTMKPYEWDTDLEGYDLTLVTREQMLDFFTRVGEYADMMDLGEFQREGDGQLKERTHNTVQTALEAPSIEELRAAVELIPNDNDRFPDRTDYLKVGYAIRAAAAADVDEGLSIFAAWAAKWEGNGSSPNGNDPEMVRADWRRMRPPYIVGWNYLAELARDFGYNDAANDFAADQEVPPPSPAAIEALSAPRYSDQDLALKVVERRGSELRYLPAREQFLVWDNVRWRPDAVLLAEDIVKQELRKIANHVERIGATEKELRDSKQLAISIASAHKAGAVRTLLQSDRSIAVGLESLDHDPWLLGTPGGTVDLRTGRVRRASPDDLITRVTAVPADFGGLAPEWHRFLTEATGGNRSLEEYLQRLAGYALTGLTREQHLTFIWGPGGNGKSVFINTISGVMGDYARQADMNTFTESKNERHTTELAHLHGARLVTASETQASKRWDEAKVKALSSGEPVTARFMRQDNFTFVPQFKLLFAGNHKPPIRDLDAAMRRRIHLIAFDVTPKKVDRELAEKLRGEWPAILAWMIEGALRWQEQGLNPPKVVLDTTEEYFEDEDTIGKWMEEAVIQDPNEKFVRTLDVFQSWQQWANRNGEYVGTVRRLVSALASRRVKRVKDPVSRRSGFAGIKLREIGDFE